MPGPVVTFLKWTDRVADLHCPVCGALLTMGELNGICFGAMQRRMDVFFGGDGAGCSACGAKLTVSRVRFYVFWLLDFLFLVVVSGILSQVVALVASLWTISPFLAFAIIAYPALMILSVVLALILRWTVRLEVLT